MTKIWNTLTFVCIFLQIVLTVYICINMSEIPIHWNIYGTIDRYASPWESLILPIISASTTTLILWFQKHPQYCNFPRNFIDKEIAYKTMKETLAFVGFSFNVFMLYLAILETNILNFSWVVITAISLSSIYVLIKYMCRLSKA